MNKSEPMTQRSMTDRIFAGAFWFAAQTVGLKLFGLIGNIYLARLLLDSDYGLVGLMYTVTSFTSILGRAGVADVLVSRSKRAGRWMGAGRKIALVFASAGAALTLCSAPIAGLVYQEPGLPLLIMLMAGTLPLHGLAVTPLARLRLELRYKRLAAIGVWSGVSRMITLVLFAWLGFGALSFVISEYVMAGVRTGLYTWSAREPDTRNDGKVKSKRGIKVIALKARQSLVASSLSNVTSQGDYIVLGIMASASDVGLYYFAFTMAAQVLSLFSVSITDLLIAPLAHLSHDRVRQSQAALRATAAISVAMNIFCVGQAAVMRPAVEILFPAKWYAAIPIMQILSLSWCVRISSFVAVSVMRSCGNFSQQNYCTLISSTTFLATTSIGTFLGGIEGTAYGVLAHSMILPPWSLWMSIRPNVTVFEIISVCFTMPLLGLVSFAIPWLVAEYVNYGYAPRFVWIVVIGSSGSLLYILGIIISPLKYHQQAKNILQHRVANAAIGITTRTKHM